jgi:hypothetical protein
VHNVAGQKPGAEMRVVRGSCPARFHGNMKRWPVARKGDNHQYRASMRLVDWLLSRRESRGTQASCGSSFDTRRGTWQHGPEQKLHLTGAIRRSITRRSKGRHREAFRRHARHATDETMTSSRYTMLVRVTQMIHLSGTKGMRGNTHGIGIQP